MAEFNVTGLSELGLSLQQIVEIPDEVAYEMLEAGGQVVVQAQKRSIRALGLVDTGKLAESITVAKRRSFLKQESRSRYVLVHPEGNRRSFTSRIKTKTYKRSKSGRTYTVGGKRMTTTNTEIGFIHEFGAPQKGIPASQWMTKANEACAEETVAAEFAVYDRWLKSKDL